MDDIDLGVREDQLHDAAADSEDNDISAFGANMDHQYSAAVEPGPSRTSHHRQVFNVGPASESESDQETEQKTEQYDGTYVWFQPDIAQWMG